ncbi:epimerase [bacterium]|nr:epimerase [bacterium]|tara:strand:- start:1933 stop:2916 length:984 start_codon:yes stop_codon:yes gene_type:complete
MKILITGGVGFIGLHLTKHLLQNEDNEITLADNFFRGEKDKELEEILKNDRVTLIELDLTNKDEYEKLGNGYDYIYHLAAVNGTKYFYEMPEEVLRINILSLIYILEWMRSENKEGKLLFTSSNEAYAGAIEAFGKLPIPTPENVPLVISDVYNPRWSYAGTKLIGEQFVIHYAEKYKLKAVIVRPHNFFGQRAGFSHVIPEFALRIADKKDPFEIFGTEETRTFCYIEDAVEAMKLLMESKNTDTHPIETVHIGGEEEITMEGLAEKMFESAGWRPNKIEKKEAPKGSVKRRKADITKIKKLVGWTPKTALKEGLKKTYDWYALRS